MRSVGHDGEMSPPNVDISVVHTHFQPSTINSVNFSSEDAWLAIASGQCATILDVTTGHPVSTISANFNRPEGENTVLQGVAFTKPFDSDGSPFCHQDENRGHENGPSIDHQHRELVSDESENFQYDLSYGLLTAGSNGQVQVWDARSASVYPLATLLQVDGVVTSIAVDKNASNFVCGDDDGGVHVGSVRYESTHVRSISVPGGGGNTAVAFSPTGTVVASADSNGVAAVWSVQSGERVWSYVRPIIRQSCDHALLAVTFSPDGRFLLTGARDGSVCLHDLATRGESPNRIFQTHPDSVHALSFAPNGRWFVSACADGIARLWDPRFTARAVETHFSESSAPLTTVAHASLSKRFCAGDATGAVCVYAYL